VNTEGQETNGQPKVDVSLLEEELRQILCALRRDSQPTLRKHTLDVIHTRDRLQHCLVKGSENGWNVTENVDTLEHELALNGDSRKKLMMITERLLGKCIRWKQDQYLYRATMA